MVVLYQLTDLWCDCCAIEAHHEQLAHGSYKLDQCAVHGKDGLLAPTGPCCPTQKDSPYWSNSLSSITATEFAHPFDERVYIYIGQRLRIVCHRLSSSISNQNLVVTCFSPDRIDF